MTSAQREREGAHDRDEDEDEDDAHETLASVHERIEEVRRGIIDREAVITARRATLASPAFIGGSPMERHAARVRELQATLASARAERDVAKAAQPQPVPYGAVAGAIVFLVGFFVLADLFFTHWGR